jgi:hypothetical protein
MKCPNCSKQNYPTDKTCQHCSSPLHLSVIEKSQVIVSAKVKSTDELASESTVHTTANEPKTHTTASESKTHTTAQRSDSVSSRSLNLDTERKPDEDDAQKIRKVFKRLFWGWSVFFVLAWFLNHGIELRSVIEIAGSLFFGACFALISTLIYWGIRKFRKSKAGTISRAAADSEIAELRRKVEELSRKSED